MSRRKRKRKKKHYKTLIPNGRGTSQLVQLQKLAWLLKVEHTVQPHYNNIFGVYINSMWFK